MRLRVHRGCGEIGGNCIEVESNGASILLDLGLPLSAKSADASLVPRIEGVLEGGNADLLAVILSHPHIDHFGLVGFSHSSLPIFLGEKAHTLIRIAADFTGTDLPHARISHYRHRRPFSVGPFTITPFLMDHSAFDAYAFLLEAEGKRIFYTGDYRGHGRKADFFEALIAAPPRGIDILLTEGTTLGREHEKAQTEAELEDEILESIRGTKGLALACFSGQNIDRFVTFFKAAKRAGRTFVADLYLASILEGLALPSLPSASSGSIRVFLPRGQKRRILRSKRFDLVEPFRQSRIYPSEIAAHPERYVMIFRGSMIEDIEALGGNLGARVIYSMWPGYLERSVPDLREWCASKTFAFEVAHTSGHATPQDVGRLIGGLAPGRVVPIHTVRPEAFHKLAPNVQIPVPGEWIAA